MYILYIELIYVMPPFYAFIVHVCNIFFSFCTFFISTVITDMSCHLFVRVSDQHESLCYFGH